jgi:hypothetical protein
MILAGPQTLSRATDDMGVQRIKLVAGRDLNPRSRSRGIMCLIILDRLADKIRRRVFVP